MSEWKEIKFSDFVEINPKVSLKKNEIYSFVEMKDLQEEKKYCSPSVEKKYTSGSKFQEGDTLFARITPCLESGKICKVRGLKNGIGFGSTEFFVFRGKENISDNDFVFYLCRWEEVRDYAESNFEGTSGRQRVPKNCFNNLYLNLPPLPEQRAIAEVLSSLDDKIDLLHRQNQTLEQMAETLFKKWFVEEAKEEWEEVKLKDIYIFEKGFEPGSKNYLEEKEHNTIRFIRVGDLLDDKGNTFIKKDIAKVLCNKEDLLISFDGTVGRINFGIEGAFSSGIRKIYSKNPVFNNLGLKSLLSDKNQK